MDGGTHAGEVDCAGLHKAEDADDVVLRGLARQNQLLLEVPQNFRVPRRLRADPFQAAETVDLLVCGLVDRGGLADAAAGRPGSPESPVFESDFTSRFDSLQSYQGSATLGA